MLLLLVVENQCLESEPTRARTNFNTAPQRWKGDSPAISHCAVEESMPGMSCLHFNNPQSDWHDHKFADLE